MAIYRIRAAFNSGDTFTHSAANLFPQYTRDVQRTFARGSLLRGSGNTAAVGEHRANGEHDDLTIAHAVAWYDWTGAALSLVKKDGLSVSRVAAGSYAVTLGADSSGEQITMAAANKWGLLVETFDADQGVEPFGDYDWNATNATTTVRRFGIYRWTGAAWAAYDCDFAVWAFGERAAN